MGSGTVGEKLKFQGPFGVFGDQTVLDNFADKPGVYLWCVDGLEGFFRVHYVGEAANIRNRIDQHRREQERGNYHAYSAEDLRRNTLVLIHRASVGIVPNFVGKMTADQANNEYSKCLSIFYAVLPDDTDKRQRCQFETAVGHAIEDWGANILVVGRLNRRIGRPKIFEIDTGTSNIEGLTGEKIEVCMPDNL